MNLVYAVDKESRDKLLAKGFNFITEQNMNGQITYLFENNNDKISTFSNDDVNKFVFTNKMFF